MLLDFYDEANLYDAVRQFQKSGFLILYVDQGVDPTSKMVIARCTDLEFTLRYRYVNPSKDVLSRVVGSVSHVTKTLACGLHSGFPPCCVAFFLMLAASPEHVSDEYREWFRGLSGRVFGYIPCPYHALWGKSIEARVCECGQMYQDEDFRLAYP